jgi:inhibitor of KinA sporulation pathway (predicted exonuclease)
MAGKLDQIIVVDLESTSWEGPPPEGQESEIIEVGICTLDVTTGERLERECILVKPTRSTVGEYCTRLTTLTQKQVDEGVSLEKACRVLKRKYGSKDRVWASFGDYDRRQFERQCSTEGIGYPFGPTHINVKNLFAVTYGLPHEVGMPQALEHLGLPLEGTHHRGVDDAANIAAILSRLLMEARAGLLKRKRP